jgi:hypothetical protein
MENIVQLAHTDILTERPFTHPMHIPGDLSTLLSMAHELYLTLQNSPDLTSLPQMIIFNMPDQLNWRHRQVLANPLHFTRPDPIHVVGFFSQKRSQVNMEPIKEFDQTLMMEIPHHDGLISYSSKLLDDGNFANLVLFINEAAQMQWSRSEVHAKAANELSPNYFQWIRIYNGLLPHGIQRSSALSLHKARYFDYEQNPVWRGERTLA